MKRQKKGMIVRINSAACLWKFSVSKKKKRAKHHLQHEGARRVFEATKVRDGVAPSDLCVCETCDGGALQQHFMEIFVTQEERG